MARPPELKTRVVRNVSFENEELKEFETIVGKDNVSKEIRGLISNFLKNEKKGYALDPLNLGIAKHAEPKGHNTTLDIYLLSKDEIRNYISKIDDVRTLAKIEDIGYVFHTVARTRKKTRVMYDNVQKEMKK